MPMIALPSQNPVYKANKEWLIAEHPFKYVTIQGNEITGIYETYDAAFRENKELVLAKKCLIERVNPPLSYFIPDWKERGFVNGDI